jgi:hypothetical protein
MSLAQNENLQSFFYDQTGRFSGQPASALTSVIFRLSSVFYHLLSVFCLCHLIRLRRNTNGK